MSDEHNEDLQNQPDNDTIGNASGNEESNSAGDNTPEETLENPFEAIIEQQQSTINALLERTESLTGQINQLLQMGVQINTADGINAPDKSDDGLPEDYVPLADLGAEFGKRK